MCWRGHDPKRRDKYGHCRDCHAIHMRAKRHGRRQRMMDRYRLDLDAFYRLAWGRIGIVAQLSAIPLDTLRGWLYGPRHRGCQACTGRSKAVALAEALGVHFDRIWIKA